MVGTVAIDTASATDTMLTQASAIPTCSISGAKSLDSAGSAKKPIARLVKVTPIWAPDNCVDSVRSADITPRARRSPAAADFSTEARSTATSEYSAAPNTPQAKIKAKDMPSRSHSMVLIVSGQPISG